jgi:ribulose-phosphate 3-epimerase
MFKIAPSILSADFSRLGEEVARVEAAGADQLHLDVMDGHFVPNLTMGPAVVKALRRVTRLPLEVHLMITDPQRFLEPFASAGADHITFHVEANGNPRDAIRWLRERKLGVGVALSPDTPEDRAVDLIPLVDMILVMTVHPGFGGQEFITHTLEKIPPLLAAASRAGRHLDIEVDGGVGTSTIQGAAEAGANVFVAGTSIFGRPDPAAALRELRDVLTAV